MGKVKQREESQFLQGGNGRREEFDGKWSAVDGQRHMIDNESRSRCR